MHRFFSIFRQTRCHHPHQGEIAGSSPVASAARQLPDGRVRVSPSRFSELFPARLLVAINESAPVRAIAAFNEALGSGDWVRVAPFGEWPNEVGLQVVDRAAAEQMVSAFNSVATKAATLFRGLPIYEGHPDEPAWLRTNPGYKRVAVGRVKELQTRDDGLYARVAFNDLGTQLVRGEAPAYEAQSPRWALRRVTHNGKPAVRPIEILSLGLTNTPNIPGTQLGLNEADDSQLSAPNSQLMKSKILALLAALGRPVANADTVTDDQLAAAVNEAVPVATAAITASNELATVKPQLATATNEKQQLSSQLSTLSSQLAAERRARAEAVIAIAINEGRITQAQSAEWLGKFTAANADFAAVQTELGKVKVAVNTQGRVKNLGQRKAEEAASTEKITAINEAIAAKEKTGLSHFDAYQAVKKEKPELFTNSNAAS